ncbi:sigma factor-like helix-turn-helix DNA-binding protein [Lentibacillus sp.]|uniref:sigma factor-like helix-turn-helix DNA-binding protein n=1 Tax=Lentibacillus sp. TaxID=1925746 RepID=UPI002B4AEDF9|nr:sigma factor-like helix-turn-helix DNA-binding protein [Lentibacillus sp.]HLS09749.1 sigma factor-like helix-turn-helix DNA-binding protein [Lentibacillus sp.]
MTYPVVQKNSDIEACNTAFWQKVRDQLSDNQRKWVRYHIIEDMHLKEIAEQEGVTVEAVKSWGKGVRRKLRTAAVNDAEV